MSHHIQRELDHLKEHLLKLALKVETVLQESLNSVFDGDKARAQKVIDADEEIDNLEIQLEEECLKILALHQPVAHDLRFVIAVLKINNDLERIGDHAVNIAERATKLADFSYNEFYELPKMAKAVNKMLIQSIDSLVNRDLEMAYNVCNSDQIVDDINRTMFDFIENQIKINPEHTFPLLELMSLFRYLERIADHATNVAEDVIYLYEGRIARHGQWQKKNG